MESRGIFMIELAEESRVAAIELYDRMSELSAGLHSASWLIGIEFELWETRIEYPELIKLSDRCNGWIVWIDEDGIQFENFVSLDSDWDSFGGPAWIPIAEWIQRSQWVSMFSF
jgi:hypothetical protein